MKWENVSQDYAIGQLWKWAHVNNNLEITESSCNGRSKQKLSEDSVFADDCRQECLMDQHKLTDNQQSRSEEC